MSRKNRYIYRSKRKFNREKILILVVAIVTVGMFYNKTCATIGKYKLSKIYEGQVIETAAKLQTQKEEQEAKVEEEKEKRKQELTEDQRKAESGLTKEDLDSFNGIYKSETKRVFLTFDDGPSSNVTPLILDLLKQENIKASFFVLGKQVEANPEIVKRAYDEGHFIANHGYSHNYEQIYTSVDSVLNEYNQTEQAVKNALGNDNYTSKVFRFPGGLSGGKYAELKKEAKQQLTDRNIASIDWNCLSQDAAGAKTKEELINNIVTTAKGKNSVVVLMHDASGKILTYETLIDVINYFRDNGYEFKTMYDLISEK